MNNPVTIGDILKGSTITSEPWALRIRREFMYDDIFRLSRLLKYDTKAPNRFYNNLFDVLLSYDLDLLTSYRDALMAECVRRGIPSHKILGKDPYMNAYSRAIVPE